MKVIFGVDNIFLIQVPFHLEAFDGYCFCNWWGIWFLLTGLQEGKRNAVAFKDDIFPPDYKGNLSGAALQGIYNN